MATTGSAMPAWPAPSMRQRATSASLPGSSEPISSSRPRQRAPWIVPRARAVAGGHGGRPAAQAGHQEGLAHLDGQLARLLRGGAVDAEPHGDARAGQVGHRGDARAEARVGRGAVGHRGARSRRSGRSPAGERWTQWASHTSGPSQSRPSRYSTGRTPKRSRQKASSSRVSARCVCRRTPWRRARAADSRISSPVTENGEHGATAMRSIDPGAGSCQRAIASSVATSTASRSSVTSSGGSPPWRAPQVHGAAAGVEAQAEARRPRRWPRPAASLPPPGNR